MATEQISQPTRLCTRCGAEKAATADQFFKSKRGLYGLGSVCKPCRKALRKTAGWASETPEAHRAQRRRWWAGNLEKARAIGRERYHRNAEAGRAAALAYYHANPERARAYNRRKYRERPDHRIRVAMSAGIRKTLRDGKGGRSWEALVGYTGAELMRHLERQFLRGMTWANYGPVWHVDHIVPVSAFNYRSPEDHDFKACWALTNLRPLWAKINISKHGRRTHLL